MDDKPTEDSKTEDKKTVSLTFTSEDTKLLVVTFAGTVAANMVTVLFVGLAIAVAHRFNFSGGHSWSKAISLIVLTMLSVWAFIVWWFVSKLKSSKRIMRRISFLVFVCLGGVVMFFWLVWVGLAAGIK
jgi:hypothetical protein